MVVCTKIILKSAIRINFDNFSTSQTILPLEFVDRENFTAKFYHLKVENHNFSDFLCFQPPNERNGSGRIWGGKKVHSLSK